MNKISSFTDEYYFLSNFYPVPVKYKGLTYMNSEAAFQAQKCVHDNEKIAFTEMSASEAKKQGRKVMLRKDWEKVKVSIMSEIVKEKFTQNPGISKLLINTADAYLEEGNTWGDRIWGTVDGQGQNLLGNILMKIRDELKSEK